MKKQIGEAEDNSQTAKIIQSFPSWRSQSIQWLPELNGKTNILKQYDMS